MWWARVDSKSGLELYRPFAGATAGKPYSPHCLGVLANPEQLDVKFNERSRSGHEKGWGNNFQFSGISHHIFSKCLIGMREPAMRHLMQPKLAHPLRRDQRKRIVGKNRSVSRHIPIISPSGHCIPTAY